MARGLHDHSTDPLKSEPIGRGIRGRFFPVWCALTAQGQLKKCAGFLFPEWRVMVPWRKTAIGIAGTVPSMGALGDPSSIVR